MPTPSNTALSPIEIDQIKNSGAGSLSDLAKQAAAKGGGLLLSVDEAAAAGPMRHRTLGLGWSGSTAEALAGTKKPHDWDFRRAVGVRRASPRPSG